MKRTEGALDGPCVSETSAGVETTSTKVKREPIGMEQAICTEFGPTCYTGTKCVAGSWLVTCCRTVGSNCCCGNFINCRGGSELCGHSAAVGDDTLGSSTTSEGSPELDTTISGADLMPINCHWFTYGPGEGKGLLGNR